MKRSVCEYIEECTYSEERNDSAKLKTMKYSALTFLVLLWYVQTSEGNKNDSNVDKTKTRARQLSNKNGGCLAFRQSLLYRGVYVPDERFDAFADGVMVNMVAEIKRKGLDPLYFRVSGAGTVEHVPTHAQRVLQSVGRIGRQSQAAIGGGVIKGLSSIRRFGNAAVQIAGNITLVRSSWLIGPLTIIVDYRGNPSITRVRTDLEAIQFDALTSIDRFGAEKEEFHLNSPLFEYMAYFGNRTLIQQKMTEMVVKYLLSESSFVSLYLEDAFQLASYDKIIPQFGADENYYSVLQYLFKGQTGRKSEKALVNHLVRRYKTLQLAPNEYKQQKDLKQEGQELGIENSAESDLLAVV